MRRFASRTKVSVDKSKVAIEKIVINYGAHEFYSGWEKNAATIGFKMKDRFVRFRLPLPDPSKMSNNATAAEARRRWRVLLLVLKAKLEAVASGVSEFEVEFLGNITIPDGRTVGEWAKPQLEAAYRSGNQPAQLYSGDSR